MTDIQTAYAILNKIAGRSSEAAAYKSWSHVFARQEITIAWENTEGTFNKSQPRISLKNLMKAGHKTLCNLGFRKWDESGLYLIPLWIINYLQPTKVLCINGKEYDLSEVDNDVRAGCIAYGLVKHQVKTKKIVAPKNHP